MKATTRVTQVTAVVAAVTPLPDAVSKVVAVYVAGAEAATKEQLYYYKQQLISYMWFLRSSTYCYGWKLYELMADIYESWSSIRRLSIHQHFDAFVAFHMLANGISDKLIIMKENVDAENADSESLYNLSRTPTVEWWIQRGYKKLPKLPTLDAIQL